MLNWNPPVTVYQRAKNENYTRMPTCDTKDTSDTKDASHLVVSVLPCRQSPTKGIECIFLL
jgi:hypothetical protein